MFDVPSICNWSTSCWTWRSSFFSPVSEQSDMLRPLLVLMLLRQGAFGQRCQSDGYRTHRRLIELRFQEPLPRLNVQRLPQERRTRATYLSCNIFPEKMDKCRTSGHAMPLWEACTGSHANANHASPLIFDVVSASTALVQPKTAIGACCTKSLYSYLVFDAAHFCPATENVKTCIKRHQHIAREIMLFHTCSHQKVPTLLKMKFEWGESYWNFILNFIFAFFLNDQHSSSFHIIGKQMKIKYLRLAPEELSTCQTEAAHV